MRPRPRTFRTPGRIIPPEVVFESPSNDEIKREASEAILSEEWCTSEEEEGGNFVEVFRIDAFDAANSPRGSCTSISLESAFGSPCRVTRAGWSTCSTRSLWRRVDFRILVRKRELGCARGATGEGEGDGDGDGDAAAVSAEPTSLTIRRGAAFNLVSGDGPPGDGEGVALMGSVAGPHSILVYACNESSHRCFPFELLRFRVGE